MRKSSYEAIVIGGGVLGASVSASLAEAGHRVLLLERGDAAGGASGGNLGQISISDRWESWHLKLALRSLDYYQSTLSGAYPIEYQQSGGTVALFSQAEIAAAQDAAGALRKLGVDAYLYFGEDVKKAEPLLSTAAVQGAFFCPMEGKLNPFAVTLAFLAKARAAGAEIKTHTPVLGFRKAGGQIAGVLTPEGEFSSQWVINCAGPQAAVVGEMAGVSLPICFHKGTAMVSQPMPPLIRGPISGGGFLIKKKGGTPPKRHVGFGATQSASGSVLIAQSTEVIEQGDKSVNMPSLSLVAKLFLVGFPQLADLHIVRSWAAATTYTRDDLPVFGFSAGVSNFFTVAGFKGAFTVAPAVGQLARDTLKGRGDPEFLCCSPDRTGDPVS